MAYLHTEDARRRRTEAVLVGLLHQCWRLGRRVRLGEVPLVGTVDLFVLLVQDMLAYVSTVGAKVAVDARRAVVCSVTRRLDAAERATVVALVKGDH